MSSSFCRKLPCESGPGRRADGSLATRRPSLSAGPGAAADPAPAPHGAVVSLGVPWAWGTAPLRSRCPSSFPLELPSWGGTPPLGIGLFFPFCSERPSWKHLKWLRGRGFSPWASSSGDATWPGGGRESTADGRPALWGGGAESTWGPDGADSSSGTTGPAPLSQPPLPPGAAGTRQGSLRGQQDPRVQVPTLLLGLLFYGSNIYGYFCIFHYSLYFYSLFLSRFFKFICLYFV